MPIAKEYSDGQITANASKLKETDLKYHTRGRTYKHLFWAATIKEAWDSCKRSKDLVSELYIHCLIAQRSDRRFNKGDSFDLKIVAEFINSMKYDKVFVLHPHSNVVTALINNCVALPYLEYVSSALKNLNNPILVSPDAGAYKATYEIAEKLNLDLVAANKFRKDGKPLIYIQGDVSDRECLIVDDLADGGRTFSRLAKVLKNNGAKKVFLYVTHGQFNYGFEELKEHIDHIYCTNSFRDIENSFVTQFKVI